MDLTGLAQRLTRLWYQPQLSVALFPLLPISALFRMIVCLRGIFYRYGVFQSFRLPVPVIVVGNLTVGGSGKTPLVLWLVKQLEAHGWRPGIISRGYGGTGIGVQAVTAESEASVVGDEPLLLARRSKVPVFIGRDRVAAGHDLLNAHPDCKVIISDDGLQHYRLQRSVEIAVFDGRGAGNGLLLPAGPLREPLQRLSKVSAVVWNDARAGLAQAVSARFSSPQFAMSLVGGDFFSLAESGCCCTVNELRGKRLYAIAGIGDPSRFFTQLEDLGLEFEAHPFPDHHHYSAPDLAFANDGVLLMTEKDAVKCARLSLGEAWVLPVAAQISTITQGNSLLDSILEKLNGSPFA